MRRALDVLGGSEKALADALGVTSGDVTAWLSGTASPTDKAYLAALDIVAHGPMAAARKPKKAR